MPKIITKKFTIYDLEDLKKDDELCNKIYEKFWLYDESNTNPWQDENLHCFKTFAKRLHMKMESWTLSGSEDDCARDYIELVPDDSFYALDNKNYKRLLKKYEGIGYYMCENLKIFTLNLLDKKEYKVLDGSSTNKFIKEIQNRMLRLWYDDQASHYSKRSFLDCVECNDYKFYEDGTLYKENENEQ